MLDLLFRGARVVDGTGAPEFVPVESFDDRERAPVSTDALPVGDTLKRAWLADRTRGGSSSSSSR